MSVLSMGMTGELLASVELPTSKYDQVPSAAGAGASNSMRRSLSMHESESKSTAK